MLEGEGGPNALGDQVPDPADIGYGRERFFWSLLAALGMFLGGVLGLDEAVEGALHPSAIHSYPVAYLALVTTVVLEHSLWRSGCDREARAQAGQPAELARFPIGCSRGRPGRAFVPFQRLGDTSKTTGVGLGLALSRGLTEAMGGTLKPEETPGGGLTMAISLPAVPGRPGHTLASQARASA